MLLVLLGLIRVSILLINMMIYLLWLIKHGNIWVRLKNSEKLKEKLKQIYWKLNLRRCPYDGVYDLFCGHRNLMKPFLDETRHLEIFNHINYKSIGLEMKEIWIFEVNPWILSPVLTSTSSVRHNSPYIEWNQFF